MIYVLWILCLIAVIAWLRHRQHRRIQELSDLIDNLYKQNYQLPMKQDAFSKLEDQIYKLFIELVEEKEKVNQLSLTQSRNIEDIAHQIKTPITGILFALENDNLDPPALGQQLKRLNNLSIALLKLASLDTNKADLKLKPVSLRELVDYSLDILSQDIEERGIIIENLVGHEVLDAHFNWLSEAIINILKNAIKQDETTHIWIESQENPIYIELHIRDDGGGIAKENKQKIFRRFYKSPDSKGFGIGLAITKQIVEKHQGTIVCANKGEGAEFTLTFYK